jgi:hypothetical protein
VVKTKVGPSTIHGIGCFADEFIPKGTLIWRFDEGFDQKISVSQVSRLTGPGKETFLKYGYLSKFGQYYVLCFDDARFFNHSFTPNVTEMSSLDHEEPYDVAARDILPGEELTCNYELFEADFNPAEYRDASYFG